MCKYRQATRHPLCKNLNLVFFPAKFLLERFRRICLKTRKKVSVDCAVIFDILFSHCWIVIGWRKGRQGFPYLVRDGRCPTSSWGHRMARKIFWWTSPLTPVNCILTLVWVVGETEGLSTWGGIVDPQYMVKHLVRCFQMPSTSVVVVVFPFDRCTAACQSGFEASLSPDRGSMPSFFPHWLFLCFWLYAVLLLCIPAPPVSCEKHKCFFFLNWNCFQLFNEVPLIRTTLNTDPCPAVLLRTQILFWGPTTPPPSHHQGSPCHP